MNLTGNLMLIVALMVLPGVIAACSDKKTDEGKSAPAAPVVAAPAVAPAPVPQPETAPAPAAPAPEAAPAPAPEAAPAPVAAPAEPQAATPPVAVGPGFPHLPLEEVTLRRERFVPVTIEWDQSLLDEGEKELVRTLIAAARIIDELFWQQASYTGIEWRQRLIPMTDPLGRELLHYLLINYGPYDRLNGHEPFIGDQPKPEGAAYYPLDMTRAEFEKWVADHPDEEAAFKSNFTVIRREEGKLKAVPYSVAYADELKAAHRLLAKAAEQTSSPSLATYLRSRGEAFLSNDYFQSDVDWLDVDSKIEVTIGPYEVYEDHLFGYKAAFEAFITVKDPAATAKLDSFAAWIDRMEANLPIAEEHKNFKRGKSSPLPVVDVIFTAGDTRAGIQTIAYNLPNDERVREQKGSKKVMLRNVGAAKFQKILTPIAALVLRPDLVAHLHEESYFNHTVLHEISHGLGPGTITIEGKETTVNLALKELYPALEEAKADSLGLYNALYLIDQGVLSLPAQGEGAAGQLSPEAAREATVATFLAGIFRSTRFGVEEAHGRANLILFNYMVAKEAFVANADGRMSYDMEKAVAAVRDCAAELLAIQALGDYEAGKRFIEQHGQLSEQMKGLLAGLAAIPVDIEPIFVLP